MPEQTCDIDWTTSKCAEQVAKGLRLHAPAGVKIEAEYNYEAGVVMIEIISSDFQAGMVAHNCNGYIRAVRVISSLKE